MGKPKVIFASDHAGLDLKNLLRKTIEGEGYEVEDVGTHAHDSCDYPDFGSAGARRVAESENALGIFICGSGIGISIAANKVKHIRAALCTNEYLAEMSRKHNNANVLCMGERVTGPGLAERIARCFLETEFEGGRHQRRVDKIGALEC